MGEVIRLEDRRPRHRPETAMGDAVRAEFLFDLASPFTYLAAERVDRAFDEVTWTPACSRTLQCAAMPVDFGDVQEIVNLAEERAAALRRTLAALAQGYEYSAKHPADAERILISANRTALGKSEQIVTATGNATGRTSSARRRSRAIRAARASRTTPPCATVALKRSTMCVPLRISVLAWAAKSSASRFVGNSLRSRMPLLS